MKMYYGNVPIKSMNIKHYEMDTNDATVLSSDLQSGVTCYARGQKITGTGKSFEFASYGNGVTNVPYFVPDIINVVQIGSVQYPVKMTVQFVDMKMHDFSIEQKMAEVTIDGVVYPITVSFQNGLFTVACEKTINIELFYGRDRYI